MDEPDEMPKLVEVNELEHIEVLFEFLQPLESANHTFSADVDPVFSRVKDRLVMDNLTNIIAQLEWIYRTKKNYEWRAATKSLFVTYLDDDKEELASNLMANVR